MKIINILNEEIMLSKWIKPTEDVIRNTLFNSALAPMNRILALSRSGQDDTALINSTVQHISENIRRALFDLGKKIAKVAGLEITTDPKNGGYAAWYSHFVYMRFDAFNESIKEFLQTVISSGEDHVSKYTFYNAYQSRYGNFESKTSEFVATYLHELFHINQMTNGAETKNGPHQGSYLDNPKIPNEFNKLSRARWDNKPYDHYRWMELYTAAPMEIGAWANGIALEIIRYHDLHAGSGNNRDISELLIGVDYDIHDKIMDAAGVSVKSRLTKTERKIYLKYAKQVYKELINYLKNESPNVDDVDVTQDSMLIDLIDQEYPNFSDKTIQRGVQELPWMKDFSPGIYTSKELKDKLNKYNNPNIKSEIEKLVLAVGGIQASDKTTAFVNAVFDKMLETINPSVASAVMEYLYCEFNPLGDIRPQHTEYGYANICAIDLKSAASVLDNPDFIAKSKVAPNTILYSADQSTISEEMQQSWQNTSVSITTELNDVGVRIPREAHWSTYLPARGDNHFSEILVSNGIDGIIEQSKSGTPMVTMFNSSTLTPVEVNGKPFDPNDLWNIIVEYQYPKIRISTVKKIVSQIQSMSRIETITNAVINHSMSQSELESAKDELTRLRTRVAPEYIGPELKEQLKITELTDYTAPIFKEVLDRVTTEITKLIEYYVSSIDNQLKWAAV